MESRSISAKTIKLLTMLFCLLFLAAAPLSAQSSQKFKQILKWNSDPNVLEYKVEIQTSGGKSVSTVTTEESSISLSLKEGSYRYRITAYDFLGREAVTTNWVNFEVALAKLPEIKHQKKIESLAEDGKALELNVNVEDVTSDTKAELVNVETGKTIAGKLVISSAAGAPAAGLTASETHAADKVRFTEVPEGKWKLVITNPSGLSSESESFEVKDTIKEEKIAAAKAEEERKERERLEAERKAKEEAERLAREEAERKAREEAERQEAERLAREKAEREEIVRKIHEQEEADRLAREEEERKVLEEERRQQELAEAEARAAEEAAREAEQTEEDKEAAKEARRQKWLTYDRKFYIIAGYGLTMPVYDSGFFNEYLRKTSRMRDMFIAQIGFLPVHTDRLRFGIELNGFGTQYKMDNEFYKFYLNILGVQDNLAVRYGLKNKKVWFQLKAGGGVAVVQELLDYLDESENNKKDKVDNFAYITAGGGLSVIFTPTALLMIEVGTDFYNLFIPDMNLGLLNPYLGVGIRF